MAIIENDPQLLNTELARNMTAWDVSGVEEAIDVLGDEWSPDYLAYKDPATRDRMLKKIDKIASVIGYDLTDEDVLKSKDFVNNVYDIWTSPEQLEGYNSFVFMVPTRAQRGNGFAPEFLPFLPIIDKIGPNAAQLLLTGLPPYVVDSYKEDAQGRRGAMVFSPAFYDIMNDVSPEEMVPTIHTIMNDAVTFTRDKLGAKSVGLGATLPSVTNYGRDISVEGVQTTTGHGGTVHLINETIAGALRDQRLDDIKGISVLGLGSIGASIASVLATNYPEIPLTIFDENPAKNERTLAALRAITTRSAGIVVARSVDELVKDKNSNVIVSAVTTPIDLSRISQDSINRKLIVDDSQPSAFDPVQVDDRRGLLAWPIGRDTTPDGALTRTTFDYGDLGPSADDEVWGCEAEARVAAECPELALSRPVTPESAMAMAHYIIANRTVEAAPLQSFGKHK